MFNFKPTDQEVKLPYFDDVKASDGWEGHATSKGIEKLKQEIQNNLALINCVFISCMSGNYGDRYGFQIHFAMKSNNGMTPGRLDIACLPLRKRLRNRTGKDPRIEGTQKMALYMTAKAIKGMYFLNVLSPAFVPFMSLMLTQSNQTLGQMWIQHGDLAPLLPEPNESFKGNVIDGIVEN